MTTEDIVKVRTKEDHYECTNEETLKMINETLSGITVKKKQTVAAGSTALDSDITSENVETYTEKERKNTAKFVDTNNFTPVPIKTIFSVSGKYKVDIYEISTLKGCWDYTLGIVKNIEFDTVVAKVSRNYSIFSHNWIVKDGEDYLITAENYQGLTVINCDKGWCKSYVEKAALKGAGFCFSSASVSPNGKYLIICGCIWGGQYDKRVYDFSNPEQMPYRYIKNVYYDDYEYFKFDEFWSSGNIGDNNIVANNIGRCGFHITLNLKYPKWNTYGYLVFMSETKNYGNDSATLWKNMSKENKNIYHREAILENDKDHRDEIKRLKVIGSYYGIDEIRYHPDSYQFRNYSLL